MSLEQDLSSFWNSYLPVVQAVEAMSAGDLSGKEHALALYNNIVRAQDWQIALFDQQKWYDGLLLSEVRIPCAGVSKNLLFRPKYKELPDGKVIWYSEKKQQERDRIFKQIQAYDVAIHFSPHFRPDWQRADHHHLRDFRTFTSSVGVLDACLEERGSVFVSQERSLWHRQLQDEYDSDAQGFPSLSPKQKPRLKLISVQLGYPELEEGMSDEEMAKTMGGMWEGYSYIHSIQFRAEDLGSGEIDRFLKHVGIQVLQ